MYQPSPVSTTYRFISADVRNYDEAVSSSGESNIQTVWLLSKPWAVCNDGGLVERLGLLHPGIHQWFEVVCQLGLVE